MDNTTFLIIAAAVLLLAVLAWLVIRKPAPRLPSQDVGDGAASAVEQVFAPIIGADAPPPPDPLAVPAAAAAPADNLTMLKGLGPRAQSRLNELGVFRFDQVAAWNEDDARAIDAQMGSFQGRLARDRWVEQARFLARGDVAGFEERFGKIAG